MKLKKASSGTYNEVTKAFIEIKDETHELENVDTQNDNLAPSYNNKSISTTNSVIDPGLR